MVKIFALGIVDGSDAKARILAMNHDLSSFNFLQRGSVQEAMNFLAGTVVERTAPGNRAQVEQHTFVGHVYVRTDGLAGVAVTDFDYPRRTAHTVINKILDEFSQRYPSPQQWRNLVPDTSFPELREYLGRFQDPHNADPFLRVQRELDETKIVLHKTMESLLQRGEKLDDLVARSEVLSGQSKMFYKTAKSTNSCCYY
ncbi:Longin-like domain-containing protein [Cladochytrium replicatum]|nr:Longin-like domain-containing protein [Cladochytrium replicatum]